MKLENKKIAIVADWIKDMWWAELVLSHLLEIFPEADIFTSVFWQQENEIFKNRNIKTSFIQKIPFLNKSHKLALMLRPYRFESFDLSEYDIVISSSSAESKWIITKPETIHICYCHTPTRYFWSHYHEYLNMLEFWILNPLAKWLMPKIIHKLRIWDFLASKRVNYFIANSQNTKNRISKYYKTNSEVIYPWIDTSKFYISEKKNFYLYVWRVVPYKRFDLIVEAFNKNEKPLVIITNTQNKLQKYLQSISNSNIVWKIWVDNETKNRFYSESKAFLFPAEEDFWLVPLEAMASWTPVIAYKKWGSLETVIPPSNSPLSKAGEYPTWIFFENQSVRSINKAIEEFENMTFDSKYIKNYALKFDKKIFKNKIIDFIQKI